MRRSSGPLAEVLRTRSFRDFWIAFSFSSVGDMMTKTALVWYVFERSRSTVEVGLLLLAYAGPVVIGGLLAGYLLDRFNRRSLMLLDSLIRGVVVISVPIAAATGHLMLWQVYAIAAVYGFLYMISLAGAPSVIPSLVREDQLTAANSLETLTFTVSGVAGPAIAGLLIAVIGAPYVLVVDGASYFVFAAVLTMIRLPQEPAPADTGQQPPSRGLMEAVRLLLRSPVLLSTTLMFMSFNAGGGFLQVWLPVQANTLSAAHGAQLYGALLTVLAVGETVGALSATSLTGRLREGLLICLAQILAGLGLALALIGPTIWSLIPGLFLCGFFSAPLTAWAQTLRMRIIPAPLRGRSFALLRTMMQASYPAFSAIGGALFGLVGLQALIGMSVGLITGPGIIGIRISELTAAGGPLPAAKPAVDHARLEPSPVDPPDPVP
jgi:MFS family permease